MLMETSRLLLILLLLVISGLHATPSANPTIDSAIVFRNVSIVPMDSERVLPNPTVVVKHAKIIAIDEPELGLHHAALNLAVSLIRVASHHCQILVDTQSAALVDCFEPEEVIVVHRRDGASTLERLSSEQLQEWLTEYTLGELWEKNVIGGGPFGRRSPNEDSAVHAAAGDQESMIK